MAIFSEIFFYLDAFTKGIQNFVKPLRVEKEEESGKVPLLFEEYVNLVKDCRLFALFFDTAQVIRYQACASRNISYKRRSR